MIDSSIRPQYNIDVKKRKRGYPCPGDAESFAELQAYRRWWWDAYGVKLTSSIDPCAKCGNTPTDRHHNDYHYPLRVRPLCRLHHKRTHRAGVVISLCPEKNPSLSQ